MSWRILILLVIGVIVATERTAQTCDDFVKAIIDSISSGDLTKLPLPSIMYSGITSNNPGQKYQCEHKSGPSPYTYFLIDLKNSTSNENTFTGICVPQICQKEDVERGLQLINIKNSKVYEYPANPEVDGLMVTCAVFVGLWVAVLTVWSIVISCREPVENQLIKKNEEIKTDKPDKEETSVNSLSQLRAQIKQDFKIFNFYEGYCRIFKKSHHKNKMAPILFLAVLSIIFSTQFSYRQTIAANTVKAIKWFDSFGGLLFCNIEIAYNVIMFVLGMKLAFSLSNLSSFHQIGRYFFDTLLVKWVILVLTSMAAYFLLSYTDEPLNQLWKNSYGADCHSVIYQIWFIFRNLQLDCKVCLQWFWVLQVDIFLTIISIPFFIIFKTKKSLGYMLFSLIIFTSLIVGYAILDNQKVIFEPYKLFNMAKQFTVNYQTNTIVRMSPYFMGLLFVLFVQEGSEKHDSSSHIQNKIAKTIRKNAKLQICLHLAGAALMIAMYLQIIPYLAKVAPGQTRSGAYSYIIIAPFAFLVGLIMFILPNYLKGESKLTVFLRKVLGFGFWNSLDKMSIGFLLLGPVVIGFTTYSMQNSIYYDFETVFVYFLGDAVVIYILTLLAISSIDNQIHCISKFLQSKLFGNEQKYSVLILED